MIWNPLGIKSAWVGGNLMGRDTLTIKAEVHPKEYQDSTYHN
jgi:hypothetical protein